MATAGSTATFDGLGNASGEHGNIHHEGRGSTGTPCGNVRKGDHTNVNNDGPSNVHNDGHGI